ncbi:MAG: hypothetical protein JSV59_14110 [Flavobacteriaceae bacterium]|nr:MAG: hypothetical protein JSV59_14110 [Flavobacteriaceae bacterium]
MKPLFYLKMTKRLLMLTFAFSLCFAVSCTNDDSDNEGDLDIITPDQVNGVNAKD